MEKENAKIRNEASKKSAKVVTVDPTKIVDDNEDPVDLMNTSALRMWLKQRYCGKEVEVRDNGRIIRFSRRGLADSMKRRGEAQRQAYADLDNLLANSVYAGYESGDVKHPAVERQDIYYAAAQIGDGIFGIRFKVDIGRNVEKGIYKDHKTIQIQNVETINIKESPSPYRGFSPHGTEGDPKPLPSSPYLGVSPSGIEDGMYVPVSTIQEAMELTIKIIHAP